MTDLGVEPLLSINERIHAWPFALRIQVPNMTQIQRHDARWLADMH